MTPYQPIQTKQGPGLLVRALWFVVVGWWLTGIVSAVAWLAMVTIIGLPIGIYLVNHVPTVLTLRPRTRETHLAWDAYGRPVGLETRIPQPHWLVRLIWFLFAGWWLSAAVMSLGFVLICLVVTLPVGLMLYNRVPFVASLYRY
jgi:uncharacterized membrane protein YccF (DUF307 family)